MEQHITKNRSKAVLAEIGDPAHRVKNNFRQQDCRTS
jgi:hypothetical protein